MIYRVTGSSAGSGVTDSGASGAPGGSSTDARAPGVAHGPGAPDRDGTAAASTGEGLERQLGGKGAALARLAALGFPVPDFLVLTVEALEQPPEVLQKEALAALKQAGLMRVPLAVRSSAVGEDSAARSFAGQFLTVLGVEARGQAKAFFQAVEQVRASAASPRVAAYRSGTSAALPMAVVVQRLVLPQVSGVAFSADPVTGDRSTVVISAVFGLGEPLVSGEVEGDTYRVVEDRVQSAIVEKPTALELEQGKTVTRPTPEPSRPCLSQGQAGELAALARRLEQALGAPQDLEWALVEGEFVLLQARPITTLGRVATSGAEAAAAREDSAAGSEAILWDNSNIIESYSGVTTPLTFSFALSVYEHVYRQFCQVMGVEEEVLLANRQVFSHMLGLIRGRIYYNLMNWYRTLALLPGFSFNREFMERMMGVREKLASPRVTTVSHGRWQDLGRLLRMVLRMKSEHGRLSRQVEAFHERVHRVLERFLKEDFQSLPPSRLITHYRQLEEELLMHWKPPLVNDFFAMIFHGLLHRLVEKWLPGAPEQLANDLMAGDGGMISTRPAQELLGLVRLVREDPALGEALERLLSGSPGAPAQPASPEPEPGAAGQALRGLEAFPRFCEHVDAYLLRFGDRCAGELKLETESLRENPRALLALILTHRETPPLNARGPELRRAAEDLVQGRLGGWKGRVFAGVLEEARRRVRDRENLRFERTRVFALVRRIFLALGGHLARLGALSSVRDVFYLTRDELFGFFDGTLPAADVQGLTRLRKEQFEAYRREPAPPDRFETVGPPGLYVAGAGSARVDPATGGAAAGLRTSGGASTDAPPGQLRGLGCCPGVVRAPVRVVRDPSVAGDLRGHILVAERTDPGWVLLFPAASGLLVQRGSLLSHSAIVARELGLPCVVGIADLLERLQDGQVVEMDGATGRVALV